MDLADRQSRAQALARTYGGERDGWERLMEYQRALEWRGTHPNKGSSAAASALDLPGRASARGSTARNPSPSTRSIPPRSTGGSTPSQASGFDR